MVNVDYLRISVTNRCNLRCIYCHPLGGRDFIEHKEILRFEEIHRIVRLFVECGIKKVRLTGGEPLSRKNIVNLVSLLAVESIEKMVAKGANISLGDFAENITTEDIDLLALEVGNTLKLGKDIELEITQIGKQCHSECEIFKQVGDCIMPQEGIFAKVIKPGKINVGDAIEVLND